MQPPELSLPPRPPPPSAIGTVELPNHRTSPHPPPPLPSGAQRGYSRSRSACTARRALANRRPARGGWAGWPHPLRRPAPRTGRLARGAGPRVGASPHPIGRGAFDRVERWPGRHRTVHAVCPPRRGGRGVGVSHPPGFAALIETISLTHHPTGEEPVPRPLLSLGVWQRSRGDEASVGASRAWSSAGPTPPSPANPCVLSVSATRRLRRLCSHRGH